VLRDLAAPDFQARNTAADLSQSFSDLRRRNFDLYGAALLAPQLTAVPTRDQRGFLHLTGLFPTRPQQINFDLFQQPVAFVRNFHRHAGRAGGGKVRASDSQGAIYRSSPLRRGPRGQPRALRWITGFPLSRE